jgi:hypothetical protein
MKKILFTLASVAFLSYTMSSCVKDEEPTDNNKTATGIVGKWNTDEMNLVISDSITGIMLMDTTMVYGQGEIVQEFTEDGMAITTDVEGSDTTYYTYNDGKLLLSDISDMSEPQELDATITATEATMTGTTYTLFPVNSTTIVTVKIDQRINVTRITE